MKRVTPLQEVMAALESERDLELPMDPAFYDRMHASIMLRIEKIDAAVGEAPGPMLGKRKRAPREHVHSWRASKGMQTTQKDD